MSIRDAWPQLRAHEGGTGSKSLRMRLVQAVGDLMIYAAVTEETKACGIVFDMPATVRPHRLVTQSGKRISVQLLDGADVGAGRLAVLVSLCDPSCEDLFGHLCDHLLSRVAVQRDAKSAISSAVDEIERWRRFTERHGRAMTTQSMIGLIGELSVLERLLNRLGRGPALTAWRSPQGSLRDFELSEATIEVKAYSPSSGGLVHINDPMQLEPDCGKLLFLACQEVIPAEDASLRLPDHVNRVRSSLGGDLGLVGDFDRLLADSGYLSAHDQEYQDGFRLGVLRVFAVTETFPRISPGAVPLGVANVRFTLSVASLGSSEVDASQAVGPLSGANGGRTL